MAGVADVDSLLLVEGDEDGVVEPLGVRVRRLSNRRGEPRYWRAVLSRSQTREGFAPDRPQGVEDPIRSRPCIERGQDTKLVGELIDVHRGPLRSFGVLPTLRPNGIPRNLDGVAGVMAVGVGAIERP